MIAHAWQILVVALAGWLNRQQQDVVEYLQEENRVLREHLKGKRLRFTDDQRRRLASKGKALGRSIDGDRDACHAGDDPAMVSAVNRQEV
jgi:hypothetical protein